MFLLSLLWQIALVAVTASSRTGHFDCMELNAGSCWANGGICHLALITEMSRKNHTNTVELKERREMKALIREPRTGCLIEICREKNRNIWPEKEETRSLVFDPKRGCFMRLMHSLFSDIYIVMFHLSLKKNVRISHIFMNHFAEGWPSL